MSVWYNIYKFWTYLWFAETTLTSGTKIWTRLVHIYDCMLKDLWCTYDCSDSQFVLLLSGPTGINNSFILELCHVSVGGFNGWLFPLWKQLFTLLVFRKCSHLRFTCHGSLCIHLRLKASLQYLLTHMPPGTPDGALNSTNCILLHKLFVKWVAPSPLLNHHLSRCCIHNQNKVEAHVVHQQPHCLHLVRSENRIRLLFFSFQQFSTILQVVRVENKLSCEWDLGR